MGSGMVRPLVALALLLICFSPGVRAEIIDLTNSNATYVSRSAAFGVLLPDEGFLGVLVPMAIWSPSDEFACNPVTTDPSTLPTEPWVALVMRGGGDNCFFSQKVRHMQELGASAVIVGNDEPNGGLIIMNANEDTSDIEISAVFIEYVSYYALLQAAEAADGFTVKLLLLLETYSMWPMLDVVLVFVIAPTVLAILFYSVWRIRQHIQQRKEVAPPAVVINLPKKTFKRQAYKEGDPDTCAICLEDFEEGAELRILPCKHEFHITCIDPWLMTRKRFCPLCKADAVPTDGAGSSAATGRHANANADVEAGVQASESPTRSDSAARLLRTATSPAPVSINAAEASTEDESDSPSAVDAQVLP